jgi:dCTP deaminase
VNPASIDLRLGNQFIRLNDDVEFEAEEITIIPGQSFLVTTIEYIAMPPDVVGTVYLKSSLARQGLDHSLAGFVDCGFIGELTCELHSHRPITLGVGQRIIQLKLERCEAEPTEVYHGRYQYQKGPTRAR